MDSVLLTRLQCSEGADQATEFGFRDTIGGSRGALEFIAIKNLNISACRFDEQFAFKQMDGIRYARTAQAPRAGCVECPVSSSLRASPCI